MTGARVDNGVAPATTLINARTPAGLVNVLLEAGRIVAIDPAGRAAGEVVDLDGRWLLPGLWDNHVHLTQQALALRRVDLSEAASAAEAAAVMADSVSRVELAAGHPLIGHGFRDGLWMDTPTIALLDDAVGQIPAVLISGDLHCCWLNTAALALFGFTGHPTGVLLEDDCFEVTGALQSVPDATIDEWVADAALAAARRGIVGIVDLEMAANIEVWRRRTETESAPVIRVDVGVYTPFLDAAISAGHRTGDALDSSGLITVGPYKVLTDGSLNTRTAYCVDEYSGTHERGLLTVPLEDLVPLLRKASNAGIIPAVHAIGDDANRLALDAFEIVGCRGGRIEHAQLLRVEDFPRFAALGVAASVQPEHAMDDRDIAEHYWAGRTGRSFALRSLLDAGAELLLGSDAPVSPLDPWVTMSAAVFRSREGREAWHPEQSITLDEALSGSTRSRVAVGEVADLIAVDRDPATASAEELRTMSVALTMVGGRTTHVKL